MSGLPRRAYPLVLAAPSGTGKTTIAHALVDGWDHFVFSVSATTRPARDGEQEGRDYHFVSPERFRAMVENEELVEWAEVHGHRYGTPRDNLEEAAERGQHVVLDIDVQGARQIRERVPDAVLIFVFPPSARALYKRLIGRRTEAGAEVERRIRNARGELEHARDFDYIVVNDDLDEAVRRIRGIVDAEDLRPSRALDLERDVQSLRDEIDALLRHEPFRSGSE